MNRFNIRVYGILEHREKILLIEEPFAGQILVKFPGGRLEFSEGLIDALKREFLEELDLPIMIRSHFYTLDFFQPSAFRKQEQLLAIYYKVYAPDPDQLKILDPNILRVHWTPLEILSEDTLILPVDKKVVTLLKQE
ncbi:MAG: NUDIX domain-containing protein [Flavobacteriales bacterium AspAUS03]